MVLYVIALVPLARDLRAAEQGLLFPFHADGAAFDGSAQKSAQILNLLMEKRPDQGSYLNLSKFLFTLDTLGQEDMARRGFVEEGLVLNFVSGSWYLGAYLGPQ